MFAECVHEQSQRLEADHPEHSAQRVRERNLGDAGAKQQRARLMKHRPQLHLIQIERVVGGILNEAGHDLRGLDRHVPGWKAEHSGEKPQKTAHRQDRRRAPSRASQACKPRTAQR